MILNEANPVTQVTLPDKGELTCHASLQTLPLVEQLFMGWHGIMGQDYTPYRNHVYRIIHLACHFAPQMSADDQLLLQVAAAFHDSGIWLDNTFDYLEPSADRACAWLARHLDVGSGSLDYKQRQVRAMIYRHHQIRPVAEPDLALAEALRKADWTDLSLGLYRFGLPLAAVREIQKTWPAQGFHRRLLQMVWQRVRSHPMSPLPMLRW